MGSLIHCRKENAAALTCANISTHTHINKFVIYNMYIRLFTYKPSMVWPRHSALSRRMTSHSAHPPTSDWLWRPHRLSLMKEFPFLRIQI